MAGPVDRDLRPDEDTETVCGTGHALIVWVVGETSIVAAEFLNPAEKIIGVFLRVSAAGANGLFGVNADAAKEDGFAVEQDLRAMDFDGAEAHLVIEGVFACLQLDLVEARRFG